MEKGPMSEEMLSEEKLLFEKYHSLLKYEEEYWTLNSQSLRLQGRG